MSDWVKFRDNLLNNLKFDNVDEALKQSLTIHIKNDILFIIIYTYNIII